MFSPDFRRRPLAASTGRRSAGLPPPLLALVLVVLAALAWWPSFLRVASPGSDQVASAFGIATSCMSDPPVLGWFGSVSHPGGSSNLFAPGLLQPLLSGAACQLSRFGGLSPLQAYLLLGLSLTGLLAWLSSRWAGLRHDTSLLTSFLIVTAPCSFSRIGHLELAVLIPVIPTLVACLQLRRALLQPLAPLPLLAAGALAALLSFPSQDYYVVFALLLLLASCGLLLLLASAVSLDPARLRPLLLRGAWFLLGYGLLLALVFLPKLLALGLLGGSTSGASAGPPPAWSTPRQAGEQFIYGLLPFTWVIPSPWVEPTLAALRKGSINPGTESFFWSTGSLMIPIGWLLAIRRLAQSPRPARASDKAPRLTLLPPWPPLTDADRRFLALLLLLASALGLLVMTMGGLGTLFAALVTPVLRSLNRFTAFVYGAAVLYLIAEFDLWLQRRDPAS